MESKLESKEVAAKPAESLDNASQSIPVADLVGVAAPPSRYELNERIKELAQREAELMKVIQTKNEELKRLAAPRPEIKVAAGEVSALLRGEN